MSSTDVVNNLKSNMEKNLQHTRNELSKIRAGKAVPEMLDGVIVNYYDALTPLQQIANINTPDARTLLIQPWDKTAIRDIETAIINSNLGFAPQNDGDFIRISIPPVTEERRKELVKRSKNEGENSKIGLRNLRKDANEKIKSLLKDGLSEDEAKNAETDIQNFTNDYIKKTDDVMLAKEKEIMTV